MARVNVAESDQLTAGEVTHRHCTTLPADATLGDVREWFAASSHRRMAFLADKGRYAGSLVRADVDGEIDVAAPAVGVARLGPTVAADAPAQAGYEIATLTDARRVPVVDRDGMFVGVLSVTEDLQGYCGAAPGEHD